MLYSGIIWVFMAEPKRKFTPEFKLEAVRLAAAGDKPLAAVARELGILPNLLRNWRRQVEGREGQPPADVFPGHGQLPRPWTKSCGVCAARSRACIKSATS